MTDDPEFDTWSKRLEYTAEKMAEASKFLDKSDPIGLMVDAIGILITKDAKSIEEVESKCKEISVQVMLAACGAMIRNKGD